MVSNWSEIRTKEGWDTGEWEEKRGDFSEIYREDWKDRMGREGRWVE